MYRVICAFSRDSTLVLQYVCWAPPCLALGGTAKLLNHIMKQFLSSWRIFFYITLILFAFRPPSPGPTRSRGSVRNAPPPPPSVPSRPAPTGPPAGGSGPRIIPQRPGPSPRSSPTPLHPANVQQAVNMAGMAQSAFSVAQQVAPLIPS